MTPQAGVIEMFCDETTDDKQWLVVLKPKIRYKNAMPLYLIVVVANSRHAALYEAKILYPHVFNTLDMRYNDPVAKPVVLNELRTIQPHTLPKKD